MESIRVDARRQRQVFFVVCAAWLFILVGFSIADYIGSRVATMWIDIAMALIVTGAVLALLLGIKDLKVYRFICWGTGIGLCCYIAVGSNILYYQLTLTLPPLMFFFFGRREGLVGVGVFLLGMTGVMLTSELVGGQVYPAGDILRVISGYLFMALIGWICEGAREEFHAILMTKNEQILGERNQLEDALARARETEGRLERTITELQDKTKLLQIVLDSLPDGVMVTDRNADLLVWNESAKLISGIRQPFRDTDRWAEEYGIHYPDGDGFRPVDDNPIARIIEGESMDDVEMVVRNDQKPDGVHISVSGRPLGTKGADPKGAVIVARDVSRVKVAEKKLQQMVEDLRDQTQLLETVFESMEEGIVVADSFGRLVLANSRMGQILGMGMVESGPEDWSEVYGAFQLDKETLIPTDELPLVRALRGESLDEMEVFVRNEQRPNGVYVSASARPIWAPGGKEVQAAVVVFSDISARKSAEIKLSNTVAKLKSRTRLMKTVFDSMSDGVVVVDQTYRYLFSNSRVQDIGGRFLPSRDVHRWSQDYGIFTPDGMTLLPVEENPLALAVRGEKTDAVELFLRNPAKPEGIHISVSGRPLLNKEGAPKGGVIVVRDISQYKKAQMALQQTINEMQKQAQLMQTVFNSIGDGVVVANAEGRMTIFNPSAERIFGAGVAKGSPDEWSDWFGLYLPDGKTKIPTDELPLVRAIRGEKTDEVELFIRNEKRPEGAYISVNGRPLQTGAMKNEGGVVVFRDVTGHKKSEAKLTETMQKLRDQSELMETTFNSISDGIVVADDKGQFLYVNPGAEEIVGMGATETPQEEWAEKYGTFYPDRETPVKTEELPLLRAIFRGESADEEDLFIRNQKRPDGVYIRVSARPLLDQVGGTRGGVIIFRDVTEQLIAEEALAQAFAQGRLEIVDTILHNIGNAINSVTTGIETVHKNLTNDRLPGRLFALASAIKAHRDDWIDYLRNDPQGQKVLPFIVGLAEDFGRRDEGLIKTVYRVRDRARHIADIVRTQKALGSPHLDRKDIDLRNAFFEAIKVLKDSLTKRGTDISVDCERAPREIRIQESQFHQMMVNLMKNSIEAIDALVVADGLKEKPRIQIRAYVEGDFLHLDVSDNGIGIDSINPKRLFAAGFTTKKEGSGLGLHSAANFVIGSGGQIHPLSDGVGRGTTMRVMLRLSTILPPSLQAGAASPE